jgi:hypothetical protein
MRRKGLDVRFVAEKFPFVAENFLFIPLKPFAAAARIESRSSNAK